MNKNVENSNEQGKVQQPYVAIPPEALLWAQQANQADDEINLKELWQAIWAGKKLIIAITFVFAVAAIAYSLTLPNIYKATTVLAPTSSKEGAGGLAALAGQFGGLASLAGINVGGASSDKSTLALEVLKSRAFIEKFIEQHQLLIPLMAVEKWDHETDTLIIDEDIYDGKTQQWVRDAGYPFKPKPSAWESYDAFSKIMAVSKDKETGLVTISLSYFSPELAKQWLTWLVQDLNETMRVKDKTEAQNSIDFLKKKLQETELADMQKVFYKLIEEQTKTMMLVEVADEYVLKTIDPANTPDRKDKPQRALIVVLATLLGGMLSVILVLIRYFKGKE
jgi:uncharacterized protein involved in exopolysaccharide biosynthesis